MRYDLQELAEWNISRGTVTKQDVCVHLGIKCNLSGERKARKLLSKIAADHSVISLSSEKGYAIVQDAHTDLETYKLRRQEQENISRARETLRRNIPIWKSLGVEFDGNGYYIHL